MENKERTDSDQRGGRRVIMGERRGICTKDPWTKTMVWGLSLGVGVGWGRGEQWEVEGNGDNCN